MIIASDSFLKYILWWSGLSSVVFASGSWVLSWGVALVFLPGFGLSAVLAWEKES